MDDHNICLKFLENPDVYPDNPNKKLKKEDINHSMVMFNYVKI